MAPQERAEIARRHRESWVALQPFVLGVLGDFSGRTKEELPPLADRCFHDVRIDTVDALMASMVPIARVEVEDHLTGHGPLALEIEFRALADFEASSLVKRVPLLAEAAAKLGARAGSRQRAAPLLAQALPTLRSEGWRIAPLVVARHARVAIGDPIAAALRADIVAVLIGERPGLSAPHSMGAYLTWQPGPQSTDADRNCISNIRPEGVGYADAAFTLLHLLRAMRSHRLSGLRLKDDSDRLLIRDQ
jgi:hypothetical protein